MDITEYILDLCEILNIKKPDISFDTSNFQTKTMMAQCDISGNTIYLKYVETTPDYLLAIAHEMRHIWQIRTDKNLYFSRYKPIEKCNSIEEYNLQLAEVDANAFAQIIMVNWFKLKPQWNGVNKKVIDSITARIDYLTNNN